MGNRNSKKQRKQEELTKKKTQPSVPVEVQIGKHEEFAENVNQVEVLFTVSETPDPSPDWAADMLSLEDTFFKDVREYNELVIDAHKEEGKNWTLAQWMEKIVEYRLTDTRNDSTYQEFITDEKARNNHTIMVTSMYTGDRNDEITKELLYAAYGVEHKSVLDPMDEEPVLLITEDKIVNMNNGEVTEIKKDETVVVESGNLTVVAANEPAAPVEETFVTASLNWGTDFISRIAKRIGA